MPTEEEFEAEFQDEPWMVPMIDLTNVPMESLLTVDNEALRRVMQRLLDDVNDPNGVISAFANIP